MDENVLAAVLGNNKAITFGGIEPLNSTGSHHASSLLTLARRAPAARIQGQPSIGSLVASGHRVAFPSQAKSIAMKSRAETYGIVNDFLQPHLLPPQNFVSFSRFRN